MKKFFKQIISCIFLILIAVAFTGYVINYRAPGELSFVSHETQVYSASDLKYTTYTLDIGDSFVTLANFDNNDSVKIRFENSESGHEDIGFISLSDCYSYMFPLSDSYISNISKPFVILSLSSKTTFDVFMKEFVKSIEDYDVIGIYLEDSDYSEERINLSKISSFCEEQHIPYGFVSVFSDSAVEYYITHRSTEDTFESYCILPPVFNINSIADNYRFDNELSDCIFQTASIRNDNIPRYWLTSLSSTHNISESEILLINIKETEHLTYMSVSDAFKMDILDSYNNISN